MPCCQATSIAGGEESNLKREAEKSRNEPNRESDANRLMERDLRPMASLLAAQNEPNGVTALIILRQPEDVTTEITESTEELLED